MAMKDHKTKLQRFLHTIDAEFAYVKYSIYRIALKLGKLQDFLCLNNVSIDMVRSQIRQHTHSRLPFDKARDLLLNVLKCSCDDEPRKIEAIATNIALIAFEIFSEGAPTPTVEVRSILFFLVLVSWDEVRKKYEAIYKIYSTNMMLNRSALTRMLQDTMKILGLVNESVAGSNAALDRCFYGSFGLNVSESNFLNWMMHENNKCFIWLPTMHRLKYASATVHNLQCSGCSISPIVGMRFQCLKCLNYNSCQVCFFLQKVDENSSHRVSHPQQEYCTPAGKKDELNSFARTIRNKITKRYKNKSRSLADDHGPEPVAMTGGPMSFPSPPIPQESTTFEEEPKITETDVREIVKKENTLLHELVSKLDHENQVMSDNVKLLEAGATNKDNESLEVLHSIVNNLKLHNKSLENELENLKSAFYAKEEVKDRRREPSSKHSDVSTSSRSDRSSRDPSTVRRRSASSSRHTRGKNSSSRHNRSTSSRRVPVARARTTKPVHYESASSSLSHQTGAYTTSMTRDDTDHSIATLPNGDGKQRTAGGEEDIGFKLDNLLASLDSIEHKNTTEESYANSLRLVSAKFSHFLEQALLVSQSLP